MARVLISAGHTIMDPGAIHGDLREADVTRQIAPKIIPYLEKANVEVKGVPLDLPLMQRLQWINDTGFSDELGDIIVEVHINDADGNKRGIEAWFLGAGGNNSQKLAKVLVETIYDDLGYQKQGIRSEFEHELGYLAFLNRSKPAAVLLETLYIDNPEDTALLKDEAKQEELAKSIARGVLKYLGKDMEGKELAEDKKPKYDDLKPYERPDKIDEGELLDDDEDLDQLLSPMGGAISPTLADSSTPVMPTGSAAGGAALPAPNPIPAPTAFGAPMPSFAAPGMGAGPAGLGAFGGGLPKPGSMGAGGPSMMADRKQREDMIKSLYKKFLGRDPNQNDLNYFLNMGIIEADLVKKLVESQEHADLVKSKKELADKQREIDNLQAENLRLKANVTDQTALLTQLNQLISHKNKAISELDNLIHDKFGVPSAVAISQKAKTNASAKSPLQAKPKVQRKLSERFFHLVSKRVN